MIKDHRGRTPRFVLVDDPYGNRLGDRIALNQFTGKTARCNRYDTDSIRRACRRLDDRKDTAHAPSPRR